MKPTSFRLPDSTMEQLRKLADARGMTLTQLIIVAVDRMAAEKLKPKFRKRKG
jgi:predicted DNA-binding protein